ncbi:MAG: hypothetical protein AB2L18_08550 [Anaerolineaceae bacterium]
MKKGISLGLSLLVTFLFILVPNATYAAAQSEGNSWGLTSQVGGTTQAVFMDEQTLYLGVGMHVEIFDISNVQKPTLIGSSSILPNFIESIISDGSKYLYVACGAAGLQILDVSNPASPKLVGSYDTSGYTENVYLKGNNAILADGPSGIQVLDVSNPSAPVWVSEAYPLVYTYDVEMSGNTLYAAGGGSGLLVVDLSNVAQPQEKGIISMGGFLYALTISGKRIYSANAWGGLGVTDITDPLAPSAMDAIATDGWVMDVTVQDSNLLAMDGTNGVRLYDIANQTPKLLGVYEDTGFTYQGVLKGKNAFVTDKEKGLLMLDFTSSSNPRLLDRYLPILDARRVSMSGSTAYVAAGLSGMRTIDLNDPTNPEETSWFDTEGGYANKVLIEGNTAYLSTHLASEYPLRIFDISDPLNPQLLGKVPNDETVFNMAFRSMAYSNGYIYIPGENFDGTVDVQDANNPKVVGKIPFENPINAAAQGNLLISVNNNQLQLVDITDPTNLTQISTFERSTTGEGIVFFDETTVVTSSDVGIMVVDVSNPSSPRKISDLTVPGTVMEIFLDGNTAYLSCLGGGIQIVDLSNIKNPVLIGTVDTPGIAYDCYVQGDIMLVADSFGGLLVFQQNAASSVMEISHTDLEQVTLLHQDFNKTGIVNASFKTTLRDFSMNGKFDVTSSLSPASSTCMVSTTADDGEGSLRACLSNLSEGETVTFDPQVFSPTNPATIQLTSILPVINQITFTIDASNAGVILDGSQLESGNGLEFYSSNSVIMGLQIINFPQNGIRVNGDNNLIGGNRLNGTGPIGEGNLLSGNGLNGIILYGNDNVISGNLIGTDVKGTSVLANYYGIFISEWCKDTIVGGTTEGEGNVISGNTFANLDTWGNHAQVMRNLIGLDITGSKAIRTDSHSNIIIESGASNTVIGGTTPEMRNVISGSDLGIIMSDPNTYQNSVIGNYIGTDITGTRAIPNNTGLTIWTVSFNRVGGTAPGESNLISGNQTGINLNGYGVTDNIILGNTIGLASSGEKLLLNNTGISINMGQKHLTIGGFTSAEGNHIAAKDIGMRISDPGIEYNFISGNSISNCDVSGIFFENHSSNNYVQGNSFSNMNSNAVRVDYGSGNQVRANTFAMKTEDAILLVENGNLNLAAPQISAATTYSITGTACPLCVVEVYDVVDNTIRFLGKTIADASGAFQLENCVPIEGKQIVALAIDTDGNTSVFSNAISITVDESSGPSSCSIVP